MQKLKTYNGRIPACGCFCGGCPVYIRDKNPCLGASFCDRCEGCKSFHVCCKQRGITHCYQCKSFPCSEFKAFRKRWLKYGQDFVENQILLKEIGSKAFLKQWNEKVE